MSHHSLHELRAPSPAGPDGRLVAGAIVPARHPGKRKANRTFVISFPQCDRAWPVNANFWERVSMTKQFILLLAAILGLSTAVAQEFRATISGRVLDASGSAVPNAKVQSTSVATGESSTATSDSSGNYTIPFLRPGQYKITVTAAGFKTYNRENITLQVGQIVGYRRSARSGRAHRHRQRYR